MLDRIIRNRAVALNAQTGEDDELGTKTGAARTTGKKALISGCIGSFLEWYDYLSFAILIPIISELFYPAHKPTLALLTSLATFGIGMLVRPLGALLIGSLGDRVGRRIPFVLTIALMGVSSLAIGLLPTYAQIGAAAPILLLGLRLLQGFAVGGESGAGVAYVYEHAPQRHTGLFCSLLNSSGPVGVLLASLTVLGVRVFVGESSFAEWGWRIPFLLAGLLTLASIVLRLKLQETPAYEQLRRAGQTESRPVRTCLGKRQSQRAMVLALCLCAPSVMFYILSVYLTVYLKTVLLWPAPWVERMVLVDNAVLVALILLFGVLSDRIGRLGIMLTSVVLCAVSLLPVFWVLGLAAHSLSFWSVFWITLPPILAVGIGDGAGYAIYAEIFTPEVRSTGCALSVNLAVGWIAGMMPFAISLINSLAGGTLAGLIFPTVLFIVVAGVFFRYLPETHPAISARYANRMTGLQQSM